MTEQQNYRAMTREWRRDNSKKERKKNTLAQTLLRYPVLFVYFFMSLFFKLVPLGLGNRIGHLLGMSAYYLLPKRRKTTLENLELALGLETTPAERKAIARIAFGNVGELMVDLLRLPQLNQELFDRSVTIVDPELLKSIVDQKKGILGLSAHLGAMEHVGPSATYNSEVAVSLVGRKTSLDVSTDILVKNRLSQSVTTIFSKNALRNVMKAIKKKEIVGVVVDQNMRRSVGIFVNFFGVAASTTPMVAVIGQKLESLIIPLFMIRKRAFGHKQYAVFKEMPLIKTGDKELDTLMNTQRLISVTEVFVRRFPEQWFWYHRRWRVRPPSEAGEPSAVKMTPDPEFLEYLQSVHEFADKLEPGPFTELMLRRAKEHDTLIPPHYRPENTEKTNSDA